MLPSSNILTDSTLAEERKRKHKTAKSILTIKKKYTLAKTQKLLTKHAKHTGPNRPTKRHYGKQNDKNEEIYQQHENVSSIDTPRVSNRKQDIFKSKSY